MNIHMVVLVCLNMYVSIVIRFYISILCIHSLGQYSSARMVFKEFEDRCGKSRTYSIWLTHRSQNKLISFALFYFPLIL